MIKPRNAHSVIELSISWETKEWTGILGREVDEKSIVIDGIPQVPYIACYPM